MSLVIRGIGLAHPPHSLTPQSGLAIARHLAGPDVRTSTWLGPVYSRSGADRRYSVLAGPVADDILNGTTFTDSPYLPMPSRDGVGPTTAERMRVYAAEASPLAVRAARQAVREGGCPADAFTHLVTVSCTGFITPGVDLELMAGLGLSSTIQRTHVGFMGCHGALNGLRVATAFITADAAANVLLCAVELCSLHYHYGNVPDKLVANAIFSDGAAAVVATAAEKHAGLVIPLPAWTLAASGSCVIPNTAADMGWTVGDHGFEMTLSKRVSGLIAAHLRPWLEDWLAANGLSRQSVRSWAVHPGGPRILDAVQESLRLSDDELAASRRVFAEYGNMSSPTVLFILDRLRRADAPRPCVALGFGPGLVAEAAVFV